MTRKKNPDSGCYQPTPSSLSHKAESQRFVAPWTDKKIAAARSSSLTNKRQPKRRQLDEANQLDDCDDAKQDPQRGLRVQRNPEESLVGRVDLPRLRVRRLKHPFRVSCGRVDFVPPAQTHQPSARDVLEVVEVNGEEDDRDDEDEDAAAMN